MTETIYRYVAHAYIAAVEERFRKVPRGNKIGKDAEFVDVSQGWWIVTTGPSPIAICVGADKPPHVVGQKVVIALELVAEQEKPKVDP